MATYTNLESMRGSNNKQQHIEDLSLCGLFLMEAAKKVDKEFEAHCTSQHYVVDAYNDITKLCTSLMEKKGDERNSPAYGAWKIEKGSLR